MSASAELLVYICVSKCKGQKTAYVGHIMKNNRLRSERCHELKVYQEVGREKENMVKQHYKVDRND